MKKEIKGRIKFKIEDYGVHKELIMLLKIKGFLFYSHQKVILKNNYYIDNNYDDEYFYNDVILFLNDHKKVMRTGEDFMIEILRKYTKKGLIRTKRRQAEKMLKEMKPIKIEIDLDRVI